VTHQTVSDGHGGSRMLDSCRGPAPAPGPSCPVETTLRVLRGRWAPLVIRELLRGDRTFVDLARALPALSDKILAERLAELTRSGTTHRRRISGWPPRVEYGLTDRGRALVPVLEALWDWGSGATHE
jgi:DNA-binding HxlR family transcriptional regulator